jgi:predicted metal-binding membrane protein
MAEGMQRQPLAAHSPTTLWRPARQMALAWGLLVVAAAAWVATDLRMAGMDAGPGTDPGALGFFLSTWVVMMVAMMLPAVMPMVVYGELRNERRVPAAIANAVGVALQLAGYLAVWAAAGVLSYSLLEAGRSVEGGFFAWDRAGRITAAGVLVAAAVYQLTPAKNACLTRCRSRRASLREERHADRNGALRVGLEHGAWCLGCCWALMAALFALGAMSVAWMAVISVLIAAERLLRWRALATTGVASLLVVLAIGVAVAPAQVPMLTIPNSRAPMQGMQGMQGMGAPPARHMQITAKPHRDPTPRDAEPRHDGAATEPRQPGG